MKKILAIVLVLMMMFVSSATAEWLYATNGNTKIRIAPSLNSAEVGVFNKGEKIWVYDHVYTSDGRNWCQVNYYGQWGYVSDRYSSYNVANPYGYDEVGVSKSDETYNGYASYYYEGYDEQYTFQTDFEFKVTKYSEVHYAPTYDSDIFDYVETGDYVVGSMIYTSYDGTAWLEVLWGEYQFGYIPMNALRPTESLVDNTYPSLSRRMIVTGGRVNVRADTNINSRDIGTIHKGDIVYSYFMVCVYDGERRIWAYCFDEEGNALGFVSSKYLKAY